MQCWTHTRRLFVEAEKADRDQVSWYYRALVEAFRLAGAPIGLLGEMERVVTELKWMGARPPAG